MSKITLKPTKAYLDKVNIPSIKLDKPLKQQQLLILDLNGTLVSRNRRNRSLYVRPYSKEFFEYVFENFFVMLWSSAQPHSVRNMCRVFEANRNKIKVIWDRSHFGLSTTDYNRKSVTIKDLDKVWKYFNERPKLQKYHFDETNTILLDDSPVKAQLQPYNCVHPSEFEHTSQAFVSGGDSELLHIMEYLKLLQFQSNVSNFIREHPYDTLANDKSQNVYNVLYYTFAGETAEAVDLRPKEKRKRRQKSAKEIQENQRIDEKFTQKEEDGINGNSQEEQVVAKLTSMKINSQ